MNISRCRANVVITSTLRHSIRTRGCVISLGVVEQWSNEFAIANARLGGVAERLIAPVLKTGRPKGLVSSNLTPSAFELSCLLFLPRSLILTRAAPIWSVNTDQ